MAAVLQVTKSLGLTIGSQSIALLLSTSKISQGGLRFPSESAYLLVFGYFAALSLAAAMLALIARPVKEGLPKAAVI